MDLATRISQAAAWIADAERVVAFTGAGISTESGLPDFRGPDGVWTRRDKGLAPKPMARPWSSVEPNAGHMALVALQQLDRLDYLISQNVDNLHRKSGIDPKRLAELHGNSELARCLGCDELFERALIGFHASVFGSCYRTQPPHPQQPPCPECGGRLVSSIVNFGDDLPARELRESRARAAACQVLLVVGTSLQVTPACYVVDDAHGGGGRVILINRGDTPYDKSVDLRFREGAGEVLTGVLAEVRGRLSG